MEVEFADARVPIAAADLVVFVGVPEGHAIGIERRHGVVTPAPAGSLGAAAIGHYGFTLCEVVWRIRGKAPGIANTRKHR